MCKACIIIIKIIVPYLARCEHINSIIQISNIRDRTAHSEYVKQCIRVMIVNSVIFIFSAQSSVVMAIFIVGIWSNNDRKSVFKRRERGNLYVDASR